MRKKALAKDFRMEIRNSLNRFLSIFFIVALGVAFFAGIRASEPDMRYSGDAYFDARNMMDMKILSTLGLTEDDIEAIRAVDGVEKVEPGYMIDVLALMGESERVIHVESLPETMNQVDVDEGRLPEKKGECIIDMDMAAAYDIKIGDTLTFLSGTDTELSENLSTEDYTVVGTCSSPMYISFNRGSTNIGSGEIDMFAYVTDESFDQEVYSQAYVTVEGAKDATAFTDSYTEIVDQVKENVENISDVRCDIRYAEIMDEANEKIAEAESELAEAKEEAESELAEAEQELKDGEAELADGKAELASSENDIREAKDKLYASRNTLDDGWSQYNSGLAQMESGKTALAEAEKTLAENEAKLADGEIQMAEAEKTLLEKESELNAAEQGLADAKALIAGLTTGWQQYQGGMSGLETLKNQLAQLEQLIGAGMATPEQMAQAEQLRAAVTQTEAQMAEAKASLDAMEAMRPAAEEALAHEAEITAGRAELEAGKAELEVKKAELAEGRKQLEAGKAELEKQKTTVEEAEKTLADSYEQLTSGESAYSSGWSQVNDGEAQIAEAYATIAENEQKLADGWEEYEKGKKEAEEKISDAEIKILDAKNEIDGIDKPSWYVNDRDSNSDYSGYSDNADRMRAIGSVFPVLFFLVAALVSLTTMTRMVEEQRIQIGTLKALGYSKAWIAAKYVGYALAATLSGSVLGVLFGQKVFPYIIVMAYKIMYVHIPDIVIPYDMGYALAASGTAILCTMVATISACYRALLAQPAELMRPEAPKSGKRVFLEHIPWIWGNLNFTWKSTVRNLLRYKKRFFMTIFGIGGCMALMIVGYGLKDSIMDIARLQYRKIQVYDLMAVIDEDMDAEEKTSIDKTLESDERVSAYMDGYMRLSEVTFGAEKKDVYLYIPAELENLEQFVTFNDRVSGDTWYMSEDSAILTEKAAKDMGVSVGDEIQIELEDDKKITVRVTDICENYLSHYIYLAPQLYEKLAGEAPPYNCIFADLKEEHEEKLTQVGEELLKNDSILTVSYTNNMESRLEDMLSVLDSVIVVLIISAGMLAFVVLYNLNNININERKRELATLKVLGFYDMEVGNYVYRENILLTIIGAIAGVFLGKILHRFVIQTVEVEMTMFGRNINMPSYLYAIGFTFLFSLLVNVVMFFILKKINMVESLKSVE